MRYIPEGHKADVMRRKSVYFRRRVPTFSEGGGSLWSDGHIPGNISRGPGFDSRRYQILYEVVGLEWGPLSLVSTTEELLGRDSSGSGLEDREYGRGDQLR
jgi:hypothetical protein